MSDDYERYHFSVTCETSDAAVLHCLRALCQWAEQWAKPQIGWAASAKENGKPLAAGSHCDLPIPSTERVFSTKQPNCSKTDGFWFPRTTVIQLFANASHAEATARTYDAGTR
jgi:hypothetical protein